MPLPCLKNGDGKIVWLEAENERWEEGNHTSAQRSLALSEPWTNFGCFYLQIFAPILPSFCWLRTATKRLQYALFL